MVLFQASFYQSQNKRQRKYARQMDIGNSGKKEKVIVKSSKSHHNYFATALALYSFRNVDQLQ